ncbi:CDP-diacylglycerol--glycerol-3-phosphate 3-phosphatidyltransferase [Desmophyllum pertusum]|uniref:CDP-diacylglycerol--glycerol-3-phosphate 3-phosphatidyltransferase n=1 Tax=Desmophyllum pertusum TaxID=174260 RepID=A0A9W9Z389_9CNID|nr:CDP-diacylglycerol--glycerol-3-phosphate 3-phosphatidyltransferase [Desmophyllum pertusum]
MYSCIGSVYRVDWLGCTSIHNSFVRRIALVEPGSFVEGIPHAYTLLARDFYKLILEHKQTENISVHEYVRDNWTFHAKGLWYYPSNGPLPSLTLIGSPNFGHCSVYRDLEAQVAIVTSNQGLSKALHEEKTRLYNSA